MLSETGRLDEFLEKVQGKQLDEIIFLTDREATEVERALLRHQIVSARGKINYTQYAQRLKAFMIYLRHGVKSSVIRHIDFPDRHGLS